MKYYSIYKKDGVSRIAQGNADDVRREIYGADDVRTIHKIKGGLPVPVNVWEFTHKTENENWKHCKSISDDLDKYIDGDFARCPDCGEIHDISNAGDCFRCPDCENVNAAGEWEQLSLYDYFDGDALDIDYIIGSDRKTVRGVRVLVAYGGPNIYIDSFAGEVQLFWWSDRASYPLRRDTVAALDDWAQEFWDCY